MTDYAIRVEDLRKRYRLVAGPKTRSGTKTLRDALAWRSKLLAAKIGQLFTGDRTPLVPVDEFWALDGVSFDVKPGEVVGIIGRNGAGKSTLLKILSRITEPTAGRVELRGRVGSLLEVGTGFHPELSGRENIYLNGAILGMRHAEIARKFDEIVAFSEIERFLDTPVKRYSSGMYVRLAFAVAAHLEPEILLVDEVLAVGDAAFQKKCMGKMGDVAKEGRTVLFVSHNMTAVNNLCRRGILLSQGKMLHQGEVSDVIATYMRQFSQDETSGYADFSGHSARSGKSPVLTSIGLLNENGTGYRHVVKTGEELEFEIGYDCGPLELDYAILLIYASTGERICTVGTHLCPEFKDSFEGTGKMRCRIPALALAEGEYFVHIAIGTRMPAENIDYIENALKFHVSLGDYFGTGNGLLHGQGHIAVRSHWWVC